MRMSRRLKTWSPNTYSILIILMLPRVFQYTKYDYMYKHTLNYIANTCHKHYIHILAQCATDFVMRVKNWLSCPTSLIRYIFFQQGLDNHFQKILIQNSLSTENPLEGLV